MHDTDTVAFGPFTLDFRRRMLLANGATVALHTRAFDLLAFLVTNHGRVLGRDEIVACVWHGLSVGDNNLTVQISALRQSLAEHGGNGLIRTVAGRGYSFVGDVAAPVPPPDAAEPAQAPSGPRTIVPSPAWVSRRLVAVTAVCLIALSAVIAIWRPGSDAAPNTRLSIAVLPFRALHADRDSTASVDTMADAITDDLTTDLSHIPASVVIARESVEAFRNKATTPRAIGRALNVRYLLESSLMIEDNGYHINAQLIESESGRHVWAEHFETPFGRIGDARTAIVRRIASALDFQLTAIEGARSPHDRPDDPDALGLFFRARSITERDDTLAGFSEAQHLLQRAVALQPDFADAVAQLGLTLIMKVRSLPDPDQAKDYADAQRIIARALSLAPRNATALAADARLHETAGDCVAAQASARTALVVEPNSIAALGVLAKCASVSGALDEAADDELEILRKNPEGRLNRPHYELLAQVRLLQGRTREALDYTYQALAGEPDPRPGADTMGRAEYCNLMRIAAYQLGGDPAKAHALYARYVAVWPRRTMWRIAAYAPRSLATSPGHVRFMGALHAAGMPSYADEHKEDQPASPQDWRADDDFAPTPLQLPGATTLDTPRLAAMLHEGTPLVLDLGLGTAVIAGALWIGPGDEDNAAWARQMISLHRRGDKAAPIVVMSTGSAGLDSLNVARQLVSDGFTRVFWYRGGEEAWSAAGLPATDAR